MMSAAGSPQFSATTQVKTNYHQIIIKETMDLAEKLEEFVKSSLLKLVESKQFLLDFKKLYSNSYAKGFNLEELLCSTFYKILKENVNHQPRFQYLSKFYLELINDGAIDINQIILNILPYFQLMSEEKEIIQLFCETIKQKIELCSITTRKEIIKSLIISIQKLPPILTPFLQTTNYDNKLERINENPNNIRSFLDYTTQHEGLQVYQSCREVMKLLLKFTDPNLISMYTLIFEVKKIFNDIQETSHWVLKPLTDIIYSRKHNLASLLTVTGALERCRLVSKYRNDTISTSLPTYHQIIDESNAYIEYGQSHEMWQRGVQTLLQMLCEQVPIQTMLTNILKTNFNVYCKDSQVSSANSQSQNSTSPVSKMLLEAAVLRVIQLVDYTEFYFSFPQNNAQKIQNSNQSLEFLYNNWWGEWQRFGSQFYTLIESKMINFEDFVLKLSQSKANGKVVKDNGVIWLISQCLPIEWVKEYFLNDIKLKNGVITSLILSFHNKVHSEQQQITIRDTALECLIYRIRSIFESAKEKPYIVNNCVPHSVNLRSSDLNSHREWWQTVRGSPQLNFYQKDNRQISICLLSSFSSQPIANTLYQYLGKFEERNHLLPNELTFQGRVKPLSTVLLACLAIKSKHRLLDSLEYSIYSLNSDGQSDFVLPPGLIDTFARLMCLTPNTYKLQCKLREDDTNESRIQIILEIINYRLISIFQYNNNFKSLIFHLHAMVVRYQKNFQIFRNLQNLLMKCLLRCNEIILVKNDLLERVDFGESANRTIILSIAKALKIHGITDFVHLSKLNNLLSKIYRLTKITYSKNTIAFFPKQLQEFYLQCFSRREIPKTSQVIEENKLLNYLFTDPNYVSRFRDFITNAQHHQSNPYQQLINYYNNPATKTNLLCKYFIIKLQCNTPVDNKSIFSYIISNCFTPKEFSSCVYTFIMFLLDEILQPVKSEHYENAHNINNNIEYIPRLAPADTIRKIGQFLSMMIWSDRILPFEETILALMDYDYDPNALEFVDYLLNEDNSFYNRVTFYCDLNIEQNHWEEEDYFSKQSNYFQQFPPIPIFNQKNLPIYFGNECVRFLPISDILIGRLIEHQNRISDEHRSNNNDYLDPMKSIYIRYIERYLRLYKYHDSPLTFVKETLHYYYDFFAKEDLIFRSYLLKLIHKQVNFKYKINEVGTDFNYSSSIFNSDYFLQLLSKVNDVTNTSSHHFQHHQQQQNIPYNTFQEISTKSDLILTYTVIELLTIPIDYKDIIANFMSPFHNPNFILFRSFSRLNTIGLLVSSLPMKFAEELIRSSVELLANDSMLLQISQFTPTHFGPFNSRIFTEFSNNIDLRLSTKSNCIVTILHSLFYYSTIEVFEYYPMFIDMMSQKIYSFHHLYILCRLFAPWLYRIASNTKLLGDILLSLFKYLRETDKLSSLSTFFISCDPRCSLSTNNNSIQWLIDVTVDFLFHCTLAFKQLPNVTQEISAIIADFSPILKSKFSQLFS